MILLSCKGFFTHVIPHVSECTIDSSIPVEDVPGFTVTDSEGSSTKTAEDANLIFSTDDRRPDYEFEIKAGTDEGSPALTPMLVTPTVGTNIKNIVVKIIPKDTTVNSKEVVVRIF